MLLVLAGRFIVVAAESIGDALGLDSFVVGATFVAFGTSMPELATTMAAMLRGHEDVGIGAVIGSNIFNGLWIVAVVALLRPFDVQLGEVAVSLAVGALAILGLVPRRGLLLARWRGFVLLALYIGFVATILVRGG